MESREKTWGQLQLRQISTPVWSNAMKVLPGNNEKKKALIDIIEKKQNHARNV